ncbi:MAG: hypothetical protein OXH94_15705 [Rhodospirillales bacterium]|nr:hypothetical protein [Rhodospirillales bacterium]
MIGSSPVINPSVEVGFLSRAPRGHGRSMAPETAAAIVALRRERPHGALGQQPPAAFYHPSPRPRPERPAEPWYDSWHAVRRVRTALADPVRSMNCYYSNLIEGHDTHPVDIERALN